MNKAGLSLIGLIFSTLAIGQNVEIIQNEVRQTAYQNKSYLVVQGLTIQPPAGGSFYVNGSTNGPFYIKILDAATAKSIVPPSLSQNFVREENILTTGITQENQIPNLSITNKSVSYKYVDGMAREIETVKVQASPLQQDIVQAQYFDQMGYKTKDYLPYTNNQNNGAFRSSYDSETKSFYTNTPQVAYEPIRPFIENVFEPSSLGRVTDSYGPGNDWFTNGRRNQGKVNVETTGLVRQWVYVDDTTPPALSTYPANTLLINVAIDEENHASREFIDQRGQTVLKQRQVAGDFINSPGTVTWLETYFVYDDLGNLKIVVSPEGTSRISTEYVTDNVTKNSFLQRWCFQYRYDDKKNLIAKWTPGWTDWQYLVYDQWNRQVLSQTPAQRSRNEWSFTKYDQFNRSIISGLWTTTTALSTLRLNVLSSAVRYESVVTNTAEGYTYNNSYPTPITAANLTSITYYDNYDFLNYNSTGYPSWDAEGPNSNYNFVNINGFPQYAQSLTTVIGHVTGSKVMVIGQNRWLNGVTYYDTKYRTIQTISENYIGGRDTQTSNYNFIGKPLQTQNSHTSSYASLSVLREFVYDQIGRIIQLYQTTDGGTRTLLASYTYNEAGQLVEKNIHSTDNGVTFLQSIDQRYNIKGWLTNINNSTLTNDGTLNNDANDLFGIELQYNAPAPTSISGYPTAGNIVPNIYDGNIGAIKWMANTMQSGVTPDQRIYGFDYDALSRMKGAYYATKNAGSWSGNAGMFNELISSYDNNGNINGISRNGKIDGAQALIDNLTHTYLLNGVKSNKLVSISDASNNIYGYKDGATSTEEYKYDDSGNLNFDLNKQISSISYNYLNLPEVIQFTRPPNNTIDQIQYIYNSNGIKLRTIVKINGTLVAQYDYDGDIQYDNNGLTFVATPEGRAVKNTSGYDYEYFYKDHQGNVRLTYGQLKQTFSYKATMENPATSTLGATEQSTFANIQTTRYQDPTLNYTKSSDQTLVPDKSSQTNSYLNKIIGPAKSLSLSSGDKVSMGVFARYTVPTGSTATVAANALVAAIATTSFGFGSGETAYNTFNTNAPVISGIGSASTTVPKAYLAYLFFDTNYAFVSSSAVSITTSAYNAFENLQRTFTAPQNGYLYVYVANESNVSSGAGSVYFDEMLIVQEKANTALQVTQASDYYPFGLSFNSYQTDRIKDDLTALQKNRYGFQGQELQKDLDLGWSQFKWRMHDPAIGRFISVDPLSDKYPHNSTYAFSENKLVGHIEFEGLESVMTEQMATNQLWAGVGWTHNPNETESLEIGKKLLRQWAEAYVMVTIMGIPIPIEEVSILGGIFIAERFPAFGRLIGIASELPRIGTAAKTIETIENSFVAIKSGSEITESHVLTIRNYLKGFPDGEVLNDVTIKELERVVAGKNAASETNINFVNHEMREMELRNQGMSYDEAHRRTLEEQGMYDRDYDKKLYSEEARKADYDYQIKQINEPAGNTPPPENTTEEKPR